VNLGEPRAGERQRRMIADAIVQLMITQE